MKKLLLILALASLTGHNELNAQKPAVVLSDKDGWHRIGETTASFENESDKIDVLLHDKFTSLKFVVTDAPIELRDLNITFEDGTTRKVSIGYSIKKAGESSPEIKLEGASEKNIDLIVFHYRTLPNQKDKKAHVEVWGKKTNAAKKSEDRPAKK